MIPILVSIAVCSSYSFNPYPANMENMVRS